jgi:hypothetical protein
MPSQKNFVQGKSHDHWPFSNEFHHLIIFRKLPLCKLMWWELDKVEILLHLTHFDGMYIFILYVQRKLNLLSTLKFILKYDYCSQ